MIRLRILALGVIGLCIGTATAQIAEGSFGYYNDALLFSQSNSGLAASSRIQSIGGAQTALGGDISSAGSNPAGLGFFNRSIVSFTPSMNFQNSSANYLGGTTNSFSGNFNFSNLGIVFNSNKGNYTDEKFKGGSFAISLGRINSFNNEISYQGRNNNSSIIDAFIEEAGNLDPNSLPSYPSSAYQTYLINPEFNSSDQLTGYGSFVLGFPNQEEFIESNGGQYQINFAWGGNYDDKLYFGGGIGFTTLRYDQTRTYREERFLFEDSTGTLVQDDFINSLQVRDELSIDGSGINATFGMIYRPINILTIGLSYQTRTYYSLTEEAGFRTDVSWNNVEVEDNGDFILLNNESAASDISISQYNLRTPDKLSLGTSVFLGKNGFVTADIEFVDFSSGSIQSSDFSTGADNQTIQNLYSSTINLKLGAEFRLDQIGLRAGYANYGDPYGENSIGENSRDLTLGVGYRNKDYFIDLAFVNRKLADNFYSPYFTSFDEPIAEVSNESTTVSFTLGFNF